jgi:hypothetical protein
MFIGSIETKKPYNRRLPTLGVTAPDRIRMQTARIGSTGQQAPPDVAERVHQRQQRLRGGWH